LDKRSILKNDFVSLHPFYDGIQHKERGGAGIWMR
jgi:hypothetical protein